MKKTTPLFKYVIISALVLVSFSTMGQSIFNNDITDSNPSTDDPYTNGQVVNANITVSGIGRGPGINGNNGANRYNARTWDLAALDLDDYFEFIITPNASYEIDFVSFVYTGQRSGTGPVNMAVRSSVDGFTADIGTPAIGGATIDLSAAAYQDITTAITFRVYAWGGSNINGTFSINDFTFNGTVNSTCSTTTTWDGTVWDNGAPTITAEAIINGNYDTTASGSFSACSLTVNTGFTLTVSNDTFIQVQNDIVADGDITVTTRGSVVQVDDAATTTANGTITVQKNTSVLTGPLEYTYWGSPVIGETVENSFANVPGSRRFTFNAANFVDVLDEVNNTGTFVPGQDDIDDDGNAWQAASGVMAPGVGYATTGSPIGFFPASQQFTFQGAFNNGVIQSTITNASGGTYNDWNFLGNPYPSAIDAATFFTVNAGIVDNVYLWSQATPLDANASGNDGQNFSGADYAVISVSGINTAGASGIIPNSFIPSGQGFFVEALSGTNVTFNNSMRVTGDNDQFFRSPSSPSTTNREALWLNLTSDNGVFSQIAVAHIEGATDGNDGTSFDVKRNASSANFAKIYSTIENSNDEYVIQGKNVSSLNLDEVIPLGFNTAIESPTIYTISIAQFEGDFYNANNIYLKDNLISTLHNLKDSDYSFTSEVGDFTDRFEIVFDAQALSIGDADLDPNSLTINELNNGDVKFSLKGSAHTIQSVQIIDLLGRVVYNLNGSSSTEVYNLSKLSKAAYIARVQLSNGQTITKKAIKRL